MAKTKSGWPLKAVSNVVALHSVRPRYDSDVVITLAKLLEKAKAGELIGFAYVALHPRDAYSGDFVGKAAHKSPLLCRGIARALEDVIATTDV